MPVVPANINEKGGLKRKVFLKAHPFLIFLSFNNALIFSILVIKILTKK